MLVLWPPNYVSATFTSKAIWTDLFWYACVCCLLAQNDSHFSAMSLAINWVLKIHIQHRWTCHTICSLRIKKKRKGKQERREHMYTWFHVRGEWTALTHPFLQKSWQPLQHIVPPKHVDSTEKRSYIFLQCKLKFFCNDLGTSLNISGQRPYAEHWFSLFP